ncbi:LysR substrate-binding domain-containing protein [Actinacidiphila acidipaludis]|uniref:LysR substrate-binding domain-containing protein n=1 Tax=Actinacidiphila acidipaludis TaxID=2873382 RepID=UPI0027E01603|nr:LysR substrate-binding domain-containing protein [Streptomyces acidipaludis]
MLTPEGERLSQALRPAYRQILDGIEEVSASVRTSGGTLTLGTMGPQSWMIQEVVARFRDRNPAARVEHRDISPVGPLTALRAGELDVAHMWLPVEDPEFTVGPVTHTSPIVLLTAATHPYAERESVCREDFGELTFVSHRSPIPASMEEVFQPFHTPSGRPIARGPEVVAWDDQMKAVFAGEAVVATVAEAARFYPWPGPAFTPVRDAPPCRWAFIWRTDNPNPLIPSLAQAVPPPE